MYKPLREEEQREKRRSDSNEYRKQLHRYKKTDSTMIQMHPIDSGGGGGGVYRKRKPDRWFRRRKKYVILFGILCVFFLCYQMFAFIRLGWDTSDEAKSSYYERKDTRISKEELDYLKKHVTIYMPGVPNDESHAYIKHGDTFTCLRSNEVILFHQINDHYCDCLDGTDEPSTSACPNNKFYCIQHTFNGKPYIASSLVNDGVCDCCDGSDEWLNVTSPLVFKSDDKFQAVSLVGSGVYRTPCVNRCDIHHDAHPNVHHS